MVDTITGVKDVAEFLKCSRQHVYNEINRKKFPVPIHSFKFGKGIVKVWSTKDIENYRSQENNEE